MSEIDRETLISDYNMNPELTELEGISVGEEVEVIEDDEESGAFAGDTGKVVGIEDTPPGIFNPYGAKSLIIERDGMEPACLQPYQVEVI